MMGDGIKIVCLGTMPMSGPSINTDLYIPSPFWTGEWEVKKILKDGATMLRSELYNMRAEEVMSDIDCTVDPLDSLSEALGKMKSAGVREVPVVEKGKLRGLITIRNLAKRRKIPITAHVKNFMIVPPQINPSDRLPYIAERLLTRDFSALPVTQKTNVLGIVSRRDLIRTLGDDDSLRNVSVETIMNFAPTTISGEIGVVRALNVMELSGDNNMAVVDPKGKFIGVVSSEDLLSVLERPRKRTHPGEHRGERIQRDRTVSSMTTAPETISRADSIVKAIETMLKLDVATLYVTEGDEITGSVSEVDLLELFIRGPVTGGPLIQIAGLDDAKLMDASDINMIVQKFLAKIEKMVTVSAVTVRVRHHHHEHDDSKYTVNVKVTTHKQVLSRESFDWDLLIALGNAFSSIEGQIKKDTKKARGR